MFGLRLVNLSLSCGAYAVLEQLEKSSKLLAVSRKQALHHTSHVGRHQSPKTLWLLAISCLSSHCANPKTCEQDLDAAEEGLDFGVGVRAFRQGAPDPKQSEVRLE